jgi:hypothetical protein
MAALSAIIAGMTALAGGAASAANSVSRRNTSRYNTDMSIAANKELAQYAYQQDLAMWQRNNNYNNPANQMKRLKSAGLNPHLVYGNGSVVGNTSGQTPKYNAPKVDYNYKPVELPAQQLGQFTDTMLRAAQIDNVRANTQKTEAQTITEAYQAGLLKWKEAEAGVEARVKERNEQNLSTMLGEKTLQSQFLTQKTATDARRADIELDRAKTLNELEKMRYRWEKRGLSPRDKLWLRILTKTLPSMGISASTLKKTLGTSLFNELYK